MKTILVKDAEKYSELLCEERMKADEIERMENMIKNPDTIEVVALAFADNKKTEYGSCYGPHMNVYGRQEQIECLMFFIQFTKKQLEQIRQQMKGLQNETSNNM